MNKSVSPVIVTIVIVVVLAIVGFIGWKSMGGGRKAPESGGMSSEQYRQEMQKQTDRMRSSGPPPSAQPPR